MSRDKQLPMSKKDKQRQKQEKKANKPLAVGRILIVCEGEKTEPLYFKWWADQIKNISRTAKLKAIGRIDVIPDDEIVVKGQGKSNLRLVEDAIVFRDKATLDYTQVWCVFDRDSFEADDYNSAIDKAENKNIKVAYTNEAFELWYWLHFDYINTGVSRKQYEKKLTERLGKEYKKNDPKMYETLLNHSKADQQQAIRRAEKLSERHEGQTNYAKHNPSTTVHKLVQFLNDLVWQFRCQVDPAYPLPYPHDCEQCQKTTRSSSHPCLKHLSQNKNTEE